MTHKSISVALTVLFLAALPLTAQTFTGTVTEEEGDAYVFTAAPAGQYEVVLTWQDPGDTLALALQCEDDEGNPTTYGIAGSERDRIVRLSTGITGERLCAIGVVLVDGSPADYTLHFQTTTATAVEKTFDPYGAQLADWAWDEIAGKLRAFEPPEVSSSTTARKAQGPSKTFFAQIRAGEPQTFTLDVAEVGAIQVSAMWNRQDTDLRVSVLCSDGENEVDWGLSESGQERVLRFDADVPRGATCGVTLESSNTMVYALNFSFQTEGGLQAL